MGLIAPSLLAADFSCLQQQIELVENAGADWLHCDIMDGHFVPNLSFGPEIIRQIRKFSKLFFDVHLMVENPLDFLPMFADCGADLLTVHYEACTNLAEVIGAVKKLNVKVGVSIKPQTPAEVLMPFADDIDNILIMTVEPGFGGQKFMETMLPKISQTAKAIQNKNIRLEVDGGINLHTAAKCLQCGADVLVAGSAVFKAENPADVIRQFHNLGEKL